MSLAILHEVIAGNAVEGRYGTCIDGGMTDGGDGRDIRDAAVLVAVSLVQQSLEATLAITVLVAIEIIPTHLVNHQSYNQFWSCWLCLCDATEGAKHEDKFKEFVHNLLHLIIL